MASNLKEVLFVASGDLRLAANHSLLARTQHKVEQLLANAIEKLGWTCEARAS